MSDAYVRRFPPGEPVEAQLADFLLVHGDSFLSKLICFGQRLRFRGDRRVFAHWSHAALCLGRDEIAEALSTGVEVQPLSKYDHKDVYLVRVECTPGDRLQVLTYAQSVLAERERYGKATFVSLAVYFLTGTKLVLMEAGTAICSGFVADALRAAGFNWKRPSICMAPADLAEHFGINRKPAEAAA